MPADLSRQLRRSVMVVWMLAGAGCVIYTLVAGLSFLAHWMAPGVWGWIGVAGYMALVAPWPELVLLGGGFGGFMRRRWLTLFVGALTVAVAIAAGRLG